jgi:hypothetical protein
MLCNRNIAWLPAVKPVHAGYRSKKLEDWLYFGRGIGLFVNAASVLVSPSDIYVDPAAAGPQIIRVNQHPKIIRCIMHLQ